MPCLRCSRQASAAACACRISSDDDDALLFLLENDMQPLHSYAMRSLVTPSEQS